MTIKVKPLHNFRCFARSVPPLDKNKVYIGEIAHNQPDYKERGLLFVGGFLLDKNEYKVVSQKPLTENDLYQHYAFYCDEMDIDSPISFDEWKREYKDDLQAILNCEG